MTAAKHEHAYARADAIYMAGFKAEARGSAKWRKVSGRLGAIVVGDKRLIGAPEKEEIEAIPEL